MYKTDLYTTRGISNLFKDSHNKVKIILDPDPNYFFNILKKDRENYEKLILINGCEPILVGDIHNEIIENSHYFDKICSYDKRVLEKCKNSNLFVFGSCWVIRNENNESIQLKENYHNNFKIENKKFKLSFIKSGQNLLPGHKLRHKIPNVLSNNFNFDILYPKNWIPDKINLFTDSMFHITIENSQQENYFTEKIIDCFMSYTIPIYWGCPNIGEFFDLNGIITFNNENELMDILNNLTEDEYLKRLDSIKYNYQMCVEKNHAFFYDKINEIITNT